MVVGEGDKVEILTRKDGTKRAVTEEEVITDVENVEKVEPTNIEQSRGMRNRNPGNIKHNPENQWKGMAKEQTDDTFVTFENDIMGLRAMARIVGDDVAKGGTIPEMLHEYAPPTENDTEAYIKSVLKTTGLSPDTKIDSDSKLALVLHAMIKHENGSVPYSMDDIKKGVKLAKRKA